MLERFLRYVQMDTASDHRSQESPTTRKQFDLAVLLKQEMLDMGLKEVFLDEEHCYVYATIASTIPETGPVIGLIAHMDTSPDVDGSNVRPQVLRHYDGKDIVLNSEETIFLSENPYLTQYKGKTLITTDGNTLLGADNKAGIAIILDAARHLIENPSIPHGKIRIAFTPDEEVGHGADFFDVERFGANFALTVDGGEIGELEYESFNAAKASFTIKGKNIHPGTAKNIMVNAMLIAAEIISDFPKDEVPEKTEGYEGFYLLRGMTGDVEEATLDYIIRDFDENHFAQRKNFVRELAEKYGEKYGENRILLEMEDQYYNMRKMIEPHQDLLNIIKEAFEEHDVSPKIQPIRGGTDGSRLSYMGLPTPNIFTGGHNYHGKQEFICLESMEKARDILLSIVKKAVRL